MTPDILANEAAEIAELEKQSPEQQQSQAPQDPALKPQQEGQEQQDGQESDATENKGQFVRKGDFAALREKAEAAERSKQELEARYAADMARLNDRLALIAQSMAQPKEQKQPEPQIPDVNVDPIGHFQAKQEILERKLAEAEQWRGNQQKQTQEQETLQKVSAEVSRLEQEFSKTTPDYQQAQQHLFQSWSQEAAALGYPAEEAMKFWSMQIIKQAAQQNKNPAELAYNLAKQRGYQAQQQQQSKPNLDTIAKGAALAKSSGNTPGRAPDGVPTIEALLRMDDEEFANKYAGRNSQAWTVDMERAFGLRH